MKKRKKNKPLSYRNTWRSLKYILLSEGSWSEKAAYHIIAAVGHSGKAKL